VGVVPEVLLVSDEDDGDVGAEVPDLGGPNLGDILFKKYTQKSHTLFCLIFKNISTEEG
jgi:hypothetical protein